MHSTFTSRLQTPYLLITDADTFFMRDLGALDLMEQEACTEASGVCDLQKKVGPSLFCLGTGKWVRTALLRQEACPMYVNHQCRRLLGYCHAVLHFCLALSCRHIRAMKLGACGHTMPAPLKLCTHLP